MRGRAELHALADGCVSFECNRCDGVAIDILAQAGACAHRKIPRLPDLTCRQHIARPRDHRAEELQ